MENQRVAMRRLPLLVLLGVIVCNSSAAEATLLTYTFTSQVSSKTDPYHLIDNIRVGDGVTYVVNIDTESPNLAYVPNVGYYMSGATTFKVGDNSLISDPVQLQIWSDLADGPSSSFWVPVATSMGPLLAGGGFRLVDYNHEAITRHSLPNVAYDLHLFEMLDFTLTFESPQAYATDASIGGRFQSFTITPEPSSLAMVCSTLLVVCRRSRHSLLLG